MLTRTVLLLVLFLLAGCESGGGRQYIDDLSATIRRSDRIVVTEHSSWLDAYDIKSQTSPVPDKLVYGTRELSQAQRQKFLDTIRNLDPTTQDAFTGCVERFHHTVQFHANGKLISEMEICFECGQVTWLATRATPPWALYSGLASFIEDIGFKTERDWDALAMERAR
jgi:hypothetical protein